MEKNDYQFFCIIAVAVTVFAILCAITVTGSGFLDLSNIARAFFIILAICSTGVAVITGIKSFK